MKLFKFGTLSILVMWAVTVIITWLSGIGNDLQLVSTLGVAMVSPIVLTLFFTIWALPIHLILNTKNKNNMAWYVLIGFLPGPIFITAFKPFGNDALQYLISQSLYCGVIGIIGAVYFWYFMVQKNA